MLTKFQITMLESIRSEPRSTRHIADSSWERAGSGSFTFDRVHASMRRLEDRGLVRRSSTNPIAWELTREGRKAIS